MEPVYSLLVPLVAVVFLYVAISRLLKSRAIAPGELDAVSGERDRLAAELQLERDRATRNATEVGRLTGKLNALEAEITTHATRAHALEEQLATAQTRLEHETIASRTATAMLSERDKAIERLRADADAAASQLATAQLDLARLGKAHASATSDLEHSRIANVEMKAFLVEAQSKLTGAFAELAGKVFDEKTQVFEKNVRAANTQSKQDIDTLLKPFADRLGEFRQRVDTLYSEEAKERSALLGAVTEPKTLNQDMAGQAAALTRALKGSAKVRGDWGELMLESVLRGSGLEEGVHYDRQKSNVDDEGQRLRPDVVVRLPDDRRVVVDSKVSLIAWQEAMNATVPELQQEAFRRHSIALRQHVKDLGDKNYPKSIGESALEITIAFVPIEGALSAALEFDRELQTAAFERRVVFASPNTLMALLRVVERLWTRDKVQRQANEIGEAGGKVLDSLVRFLEKFDAVGLRLNDASQVFADARRALSESPQAAIPRARRMAELGARGKRALPVELTPDVSDLFEAKEVTA